MNKGIAKATGDYILFLNAGDTFPNNQTLEAISRCTQQQNPLPAVLYGDTDIVDTNGKFIRHRRLSPPANLSWRSFKHGMLVCHQAATEEKESIKFGIFEKNSISLQRNSKGETLWQESTITSLSWQAV